MKRINYDTVSNGDEFISYILVSYILVLTAKNEQFFTFYLKNKGSVMSIFAHFLHYVVFSMISNTMKGDDFITKKEEINNETTIFIPERLITNREFSNYSLATYCVLHTLSQPTQILKLCITQYQIEIYLTGKISNRRLMSDYVKCGINELIENHLLEKLDEKQKHYILDCSKLRIDTNKEHFTIITFGEVQKIFQVENINNFLLLRYFISLMWTISSKITVYLPNGNFKNRVVGNFTIDYLSELTNIGVRTIIEYNKILEEIGLIYIHRQNDFVLDKENNIKRLNNIYGRASDMEYIITFANNQQKHYESYHYLENNNKKANNKRRLAQMYQQLLKGRGGKYSNEEILAIYKYVISENEKYERMYEKDKYEDYLDKIRDTDVFKQFKFIESEEN